MVLHEEPSDGSSLQLSNGSSLQSSNGSSLQPSNGSSLQPISGSSLQPSNGYVIEPSHLSGSNEEPSTDACEELFEVYRSISKNHYYCYSSFSNLTIILFSTLLVKIVTVS